jgi:hypothetical protein
MALPINPTVRKKTGGCNLNDITSANTSTLTLKLYYKLQNKNLIVLYAVLTQL